MFLENVDKIVAEQCGGSQTKFNNIIDQRDAATRWKNQTNPSFRAILNICEKFNCDIAWLLTGRHQITELQSVFSKKAMENFLFLKTITARANRAAQENCSPLAFAKVLQKYVEAEIIQLEDVYKIQLNSSGRFPRRKN